MRFTVVATGQFSLDRAFGFGLAASSLTQLSVVNSPIRPAGLSPAWHPASPAHIRTPKLNFCVGGVRPSRPQPGAMGGWLRNVSRLERSLLLRPGTGALRQGLVRPATIGNFGVRVQFGLFLIRVYPCSSVVQFNLKKPSMDSLRWRFPASHRVRLQTPRARLQRPF